MGADLLEDSNVKKPKAELKKVVIFCPNLKRNVTVKGYSFSAVAGDCDTCGEHGHVTILIQTCRCKRTHEIQVEQW